jgi:hypothetical protein
MACNALFPPTDNAPLTTVRAGNERLFKLVHAQILKLEPTLANAAALNSSPLIPSIRNANCTVSSFGKLTVERSIVVMLYAVFEAAESCFERGTITLQLQFKIQSSEIHIDSFEKPIPNH